MNQWQRLLESEIFSSAHFVRLCSKPVPGADAYRCRAGGTEAREREYALLRTAGTVAAGSFANFFQLWSTQISTDTP